MNYHVLVSTLKARFEPDNQSQLYRPQLKSRILVSHESLAEVAKDIRRLTRMANSSANSEFHEILAKDSFTLKTKVGWSNKEKLVDPTMSNLSNQVSYIN